MAADAGVGDPIQRRQASLVIHLRDFEDAMIGCHPLRTRFHTWRRCVPVRGRGTQRRPFKRVMISAVGRLGSRRSRPRSAFQRLAAEEQAGETALRRAEATRNRTPRLAACANTVFSCFARSTRCTRRVILAWLAEKM